VSKPLVTAIVVVFNPDATYLQQCVDSLLQSVLVDIEVIVIDNDSAEPVALPQPAAAMVHRLDTNRGFAAGVNAGIALARGEYIWLLNDDAWVEPGCIAATVAELSAAEPKVIAVAPKVLVADDERRIIDSVGNVLMPTGEGFNLGIGQPDIGQFDVPERCFGVCFAAGLFRRSAFDRSAVGPLDERYFLYYEDIDWSLRANRKGFVFRTCPLAVAYHRHSTTTRRLGLANRYRIVERNLLINATKNLGARSIFLIWLRRFYVHTVGLVRGPYRLARWRAIAGAMIRTPAVVVRRFWYPAPKPAMTDTELFAFADGEQPFFDADEFRATDPEAAHAAALARLARRRV
jgi:GT2 family glycosyltransferase